MKTGQSITEVFAFVRRDAWIAAGIAMAAGFVIGAFICPTWQVAVETAQVRAGLLEYPDSNNFYRYHLHAWTILHQILAIPLKLGISERVVSITLSGVLTGATFAAMAMIAAALRSGIAVAVLAPIVWFTLFGSGNAYGIVYPIFSVGTHHTYGIAGRAVALWLVALLSVRAYRPALFLAGLAPAIHLTWGACAIAICAVALAWSRDGLQPVRTHIGWLVSGACVTAISRLDNLWQRARLPAVDREAAGEIVAAFQQHWDVHRSAADLFVPGSILVIASLVLGAYVYRQRGRDTDFPVIALLIASTIGLCGLALTFFSDVLPPTVSAAMPGRFANLTLMVLPAVLPALLLQGVPSGAPFRVAVLGFAGYLLYPAMHLGFETYLSSDRFGWELPHWMGALVLMLLIAIAHRKQTDDEFAVRNDRWVNATAGVIGAGLFVLATVSPLRPTGIGFDPATDFVFEAAADTNRAIVSGPGMELVQLRSRAPVLVNTGGLDQLPYVPSSAPYMNRTLRIVYGVDLREAPGEPSATLFDGTRERFESRSVPDWKTIRAEFPDYPPMLVLTPVDWELDLPVVAESPTLRLYEIPENTDAEAAL